MIELRDICFEPDGVKILENISLKIKENERFVLLGPGGHGKSVLLKIIAGILDPTSGSVEILKNESCSGKPSLSMVFQQNALFDSINAFDNIAFPLNETTSLKRNEIAECVRDILAEVGLSAAGSLFPHELSGGMQKRIALARALVIKPDILLLDDPTAGLDPVNSEEMIGLILSLQNKYKSAILMVTSDLKRAYEAGSRFGILINGKVSVYDSVESLKDSNQPEVRQFIHGLKNGPLSEIYAED